MFLEKHVCKFLDLSDNTFRIQFLIAFLAKRRSFMSVKTIFLTSPHSNFIYIFIYGEDRALVTQRITARKLECGDVRKIVARPEIEMIKKRGSSAERSRRNESRHEKWNVAMSGKW